MGGEGTCLSGEPKHFVNVAPGSATAPPRSFISSSHRTTRARPRETRSGVGLRDIHSVFRHMQILRRTLRRSRSDVCLCPQLLLSASAICY